MRSTPATSSRVGWMRIAGSRPLLASVVSASILCSEGALRAEQIDQVEQLQFECRVALLLPQGQFTDSTPITIHFARNGENLTSIRVVDEGAILYPGGNMRLVRRPDAIALEAVPVPAERPGRWTGRAERGMYRLTLASGQLAEAVTIGLGRSPATAGGRYGVIWNATNQPEGMSRPISGSGGGNCARVSANGGAE